MKDPKSAVITMRAHKRWNEIGEAVYKLRNALWQLEEEYALTPLEARHVLTSALYEESRWAMRRSVRQPRQHQKKG
jgi:hypothetical protein